MEFILAYEAAIEHKLIQTWSARYGFDLEIGVAAGRHFGFEIHQGIASFERQAFKQAQRPAIASPGVQEVDATREASLEEICDGKRTPVTIWSARQFPFAQGRGGENIPAVLSTFGPFNGA